MNTINIIGNLIKDPVLTLSQSGKPYCNFCIAYNHWQKQADGTAKSSLFNCVCFGVTAEFVANNAVKGTKLAVTGEAMQDVYADKETSKQRTSFKISCTSVDVLGSKQAQPVQATQTTINQDIQQSMNIDASQIHDPFDDQ